MHLNKSYHKTVRPSDLMQVVDGTAAAIKKWIAESGITPTHIVCMGSSGQAVAWPVSYKLGIPVCVVRKRGENSHAGRITGDGVMGTYIVVDDLIESGATITRVFGTIREAVEDTNMGRGESFTVPNCAAIFLYNEGERSAWRGSGVTFRDTGVPVIADKFA